MKNLFVFALLAFLTVPAAHAEDDSSKNAEVAQKVAIALPLNAEISGVLGVITTQRHIICPQPKAEEIMVDTTRANVFDVTYVCKGATNPQEDQKLIVTGTYAETNGVFGVLLSSLIINF